MINFEVKIENLPQLKEAMNNYPAIASPILARALVATQFIFQKHTLKGDPVPWRTGNLLQSFRFKTSPNQAQWGPTAKYAPFVEFDTRPHMIAPKNKPFLAWQSAKSGGYQTSRTGREYYKSSGGDWRYSSRAVRHPGTKGQHFTEKIAKNSSDEVGRLFGEAADLIVRGIADRIGQ